MSNAKTLKEKKTKVGGVATPPPPFRRRRLGHIMEQNSSVLDSSVSTPIRHIIRLYYKFGHFQLFNYTEYANSKSVLVSHPLLSVPSVTLKVPSILTGTYRESFDPLVVVLAPLCCNYGDPRSLSEVHLCLYAAEETHQSGASCIKATYNS